MKLPSSSYPRNPSNGVDPTSVTRCKDPGNLSPRERLRELTAILVRGVHLLRESRPVWPESGQFPADSSPPGLEAVATSRPYGLRCQPERPTEE